MMPPTPTIEYTKCLRDGAIGGIGAIPGTFCAHFCDVIKMRQQLTGERLGSAIRGIYRGRRRSYCGTSSNNSSSLLHFFAGSIPAIQQKVTTRSTMFLASSISVQFFEHRLSLDATSAAFVGSATSGYITGFIASPWEWQKVLVSQRVNSPVAGKGVVKLLVEARKCHGGFIRGFGYCVGRRMHAAGTRNAIFDSTFFGTKRVLEDRWNNNIRGTTASAGFAYGAAAIVAVTVDYAVDVSAKRTYSVGPERPIPTMGVVRHTLHIVSNEGMKIFRGLGMKSVEFGISYMITGLMAPHIVRVVEDLV